jgi:hypothetical protein
MAADERTVALHPRNIFGGRDNMLKIAVAAALTSLIFYDVIVAERSTGTVEFSVPHRSQKGDRLPIAPACSTPALPSDNVNCLRKRMPETNQPQQAKELRLAGIGRLLEATLDSQDRCDCRQ